MNIRRALLTLGAMILGVGFFGAFPQQAQAQTPFCVPSNPNSTPWPPTNSTLACQNSSYFGIMRVTLEQLGNDGSDAAWRLRTAGTAAGDQVSVTLFDVTTQQSIGTADYITVADDTPVIIARKIAESVNSQFAPDLFAYQSSNVVTILSLSGHEISFSAHQSGNNGLTLTTGAPDTTTLTATIDGVARNDITWWQFASPPDFFNCSNLPASGCPVDSRPTSLPNGTFGVTWGTANGGYTAVFEASNGSSTFNNRIRHTTAHETGHQLDVLYGIAGFGDPGTNFAQSAAFKAAVQRDLDVMALVPPCNFQASNGQRVVDDPPVQVGGDYASMDPVTGDPLGTGGLPGFFSGEIHDQYGNLICDDRNSNVAGANTVEILKNAYPYLADILDPNAVTPRENELFAEIYSALYAGGSGYPDTLDDDGNPYNPSSDRAFLETGAFMCARLYIQTLTQNGRLPTEDELSWTGYSVPGIIGSGPDAGMYGYGATNFYCDNSTEYQGDYGFGS